MLPVKTKRSRIDIGDSWDYSAVQAPSSHLSPTTLRIGAGLGTIKYGKNLCGFSSVARVRIASGNSQGNFRCEL